MTTLAMGKFRAWWEDFRRIVDEGDPHRAAARLTEHLEALPAEERRPFRAEPFHRFVRFWIPLRKPGRGPTDHRFAIRE